MESQLKIIINHSYTGIAVKGLKHTAGIESRKNIIATEDAEVVDILKKAGGIIIAVTNTPELASWFETYNPLHGRTSNPYNTNFSAGGRYIKLQNTFLMPRVIGYFGDFFSLVA